MILVRVLALLALLLALHTSAEEPVTPAPKPELTTADFEKLTAQLASEDFELRQDAHQKLISGRKAAQQFLKTVRPKLEDIEQKMQVDQLLALLDTGGPLVNGISVKLTLTKQNIVSGEKVGFSITYFNHSDKPLLVSVGYRFFNGVMLLERMDKGQALPLSIGMSMHDLDPDIPMRMCYEEVPPHKTFTRIFQINVRCEPMLRDSNQVPLSTPINDPEALTFPGPGTYSIRAKSYENKAPKDPAETLSNLKGKVSQSTAPHWIGQAVSDELELTIKKAEPASGK